MIGEQIQKLNDCKILKVHLKKRRTLCRECIPWILLAGYYYYLFVLTYLIVSITTSTIIDLPIFI